MDNGENKYCYKYPHPAVTADCIIFGACHNLFKILLVKRGVAPFKGKWAFPGGFMKIDETAEECALRELKEETGLENVEIEQLHTYTAVNRDPRERVITIAYMAIVDLTEVKGGDDAAMARWFSLDQIPELAFDHQEILHAALTRLKERTNHIQPYKSHD